MTYDSAPPPFSASPIEMRRAFAVRAVAVATDRSNGIGTVELTCLPEGLEIHFVSMAPHAPGYAPSPATGKTRVLVPYAKVQDVERDGVVLRLEVDPIYTPFNRLALMHLTLDRSALHVTVVDGRRRIRRTARWAAAIIWIPVVGLVHVCIPGVCGLGLSAVAVATSALTMVFGNVLARRIAFADEGHKDVREALIAELFVFGVPARLAPQSGPALPPPPAALLLRHPELQKDLFSTGLAVATFAGIGLLALALGRALLDESSRTTGGFAPAAQDNAASSPASPSLPLATAATVAAVAKVAPDTGAAGPLGSKGVVEAEACGCPRADSSLWEDGVPELSVFTVPHDDMAGKRADRVDLDVVVVNNGAATMKDLDLSATLTKRARKEGDAPHTSETRGLFWAGELPGGSAGKWHVRGHADDVVPLSAYSGLVGENDLGPAPADAFAALLSARTRAVRVHGAKMLAYVRDPRALMAVAKLREAGRDDEAPVLDRIARAAAPFFGCGSRGSLSDPHTLHVVTCVMNGSKMPATGLTVRASARRKREKGASPANVAALPTAFLEASWVLAPEVSPGRGLLASHDEPLDEPLDLKGVAFDVEVDDLRNP